MIDILQQVFAFVVTLGLLISFHEFGHFWVARQCNVKIISFSIGFGRPLWSKRLGHDQFELIIAALPLGGYVKMLDEREGPVAAADLPRTFNSKSLLQRTLIVLAGPLFNFIFAIIVFWLMFMIGITGLKPIVGSIEADSIAARAGLYEGVEIIAVDSRETQTWTTVADALMSKVIDSDRVDITIRDKSAVDTLSMDIQDISIDDLTTQGLLTILGIGVRKIKLPAIVGNVYSGLPAAEAGLLPQDLVISADGQPITDWRQWVEYVQAHPKQKIMVGIERQEEYLTLDIIPHEKLIDGNRIIGFIGAASQPIKEADALFNKESYFFVPAFLKSIEKTWDMSWLTLSMLGKIIIAQVSVKNLSGPISIAQYAGDSAQGGIVSFLWFLGVVSISIGVLNLLPIPLLDGGHLLYYVAELFKGSPVSEATQIISQQIGFILLLGVMVLVTYNDVIRLMS